MENVSNLVTVSCPNHYEELTIGLLNFIATKHRTDYSVKFRAGLVHAHQLILDVFLPPENLDRKVLCENRDILEALIQFMYAGSVTIKADKLELLRSIGERLDFKLLLDAVETASTQATGSCDIDRQATGNDCDGNRATNSSLKITGTNVRVSRKGRPIKIPHPASMVVAELGDMSHSPEGIVTLLTEEDRDSQDGVEDLYNTQGQHQDDSSDETNSEESEQSGDDVTTPEDSDEDYVTKVVRPTRSTTVRRTRAGAGTRTETGTEAGTSGNCERIRLYNLTHPKIRCENPPCKFRSRSDNAYQVHLATQHGSGRELFPCPSCPYSRPFIDAAQLERHQRVKHRRKKGDAVECSEFHQCLHCDYKTRHKVLYVVHLSRRHGEDKGEIFRCDKCSKPFLKSDALERHKQSHKQYKCGHCDFETPKSGIYRHHLFSEHRVNEKGQSVEKIPCPHCDYSGKNNCHLRHHIATRHMSTLDKPYKCTFAPECNYASGRKGDRDKHVRFAHLGQKNYMCEFCSFRTTTSFSLKVHLRKHSLDRPFQCTFCEKKFSGKDSLRKHTKLHTSNEKNHLCHLCTFACNRRDNLRTHLKGVHKITQFDKSVN